MGIITFVGLAALFGIVYASSIPQQNEHGRYIRSNSNVPDCGRLPGSFEGGNLPWNALVFIKLDTHNNQPNNRYLCGGTLVKPKVVISVAHCVTSSDGTLRPATQYAVALGNSDRSWAGSDSGVQTSDVSSITIPKKYLGHPSNYQNDISILKLTQAARFTPTVRPACITFDRSFESQLTNGAIGKIVFPKDNLLRTREALYTPMPECLSKNPKDFAPYLTADKICATVSGNPNLVGIGGAGLAFSYEYQETTRHYVIGSASTAPQNISEPVLIAFTRLIDHEDFIKKALFDGEEL